jgi:Flp pilus assembly protein TadD
MGKVSKEKKRDSLKRKNKDDKREAEFLTQRSTNHFNKPLIHCLLIIAIGLLAYSNSFNSPFQWDENDFLVQNPIVKNLRYFWEPSRAKAGDPVFYFFLRTRYIGYLTFAINYKLHGFHVLGYHIFNLTIHLSNALLVYLLILLTFETPFLKASSLKKSSNLIALFSALIFVSHPLQTEAVTYIYQRLASLLTFFYLFSIVFYIQWRLCLDDQKISYFKSTPYFILSLISTLFAMKTKENALTLPLVIFIYEFFFFSGRIKTRVLRLLPWVLSMTIIPLTMIGTDRPIGEVFKLILDPFQYVQADLSKGAQLFTQCRVILTYIRLLFLPIHQNLDYDYPVYHSFFTPPVFLSFLFLLSVLSLAFYLFYRSRTTTPDLRLISFGIFWFFVTLSIESSIISIVIVIFEYRVYLPSFGWAMAITTSAWIALEKLKPRFPGIEKKVIFFFLFIVILFSVLTFARNEVWRDEIRLWRDVVSKSPNKSRGHFKLGLFLGKKGRFDEAIREFQTTLKLEPNQARVHNNLALIYAYQGKLDDAIKEYHTALTINPKDAVVHYNLGLLFGRIQRLNDAVREFQITLKLNPLDANAHNSLGVIFGLQGRLDEAIKEFKTALEIEPDHRNARNNLTQIYKKKD